MYDFDINNLLLVFNIVHVCFFTKTQLVMRHYYYKIKYINLHANNNNIYNFVQIIIRQNMYELQYLQSFCFWAREAAKHIPGCDLPAKIYAKPYTGSKHTPGIVWQVGHGLGCDTGQPFCEYFWGEVKMNWNARYALSHH